MFVLDVAWRVVRRASEGREEPRFFALPLQLFFANWSSIWSLVLVYKANLRAFQIFPEKRHSFDFALTSATRRTRTVPSCDQVFRAPVVSAKGEIERCGSKVCTGGRGALSYQRAISRVLI